MAIMESLLVAVAEVAVNDEMRVELKQFRKRVDYTPGQAEQLAEELIAGAVLARQLLEEQINQSSTRTRQVSLAQAKAVI